MAKWVERKIVKEKDHLTRQSFHSSMATLDTHSFTGYVPRARHGHHPWGLWELDELPCSLALAPSRLDLRPRALLLVPVFYQDLLKSGDALRQCPAEIR